MIPGHCQCLHHAQNFQNQLTVVNWLWYLLTQRTSICSLGALDLELRAVHPTVCVHGLLQSVTLPTEDIVSMSPIARRIAHAKDERLRAIFRPVIWIVECARVPSDLIQNLRNMYWVRCRAWSACLERPVDGVCDVALVIRRIEVDSIPTPALVNSRSETTAGLLLLTLGRSDSHGYHPGKASRETT